MFMLLVCTKEEKRKHRSSKSIFGKGQKKRSKKCDFWHVKKCAINLLTWFDTTQI